MTLEEVHEFLEEHEHEFKLTFALEYSRVIDWCAEFVPGRNHHLARQYGGPWVAQAMSPEEAIEKAKARFLEMKD